MFAAMVSGVCILKLKLVVSECLVFKGVLLFLLSLLKARKKLRNRFLTVSRTECQDRLRPSVDLPRRLSGVYCSN